MGLMIVRHKVKDFGTWKKSFDGHAAAQKAAGLTKPPRVFRSADDGYMTAGLCDAGDEACSTAPLLLLCRQVDDLRS
jgi:hypothetical protein